ncbi:MAG: hypothetical protein JWN73_2660 [Betaproteobacteria bacterium]|nr:hypothetical protein [Betaproteobacteria bacterium]
MAKNGQQSTNNNTLDNAKKPKKRGRPEKAQSNTGKIPAKAGANQKKVG